MRYKGYLIEESESKVELQKAIEDLMEEGWVLLGGVSVVCAPEGVIVYCQALVPPE